MMVLLALNAISDVITDVGCAAYECWVVGRTFQDTEEREDAKRTFRNVMRTQIWLSLTCIVAKFILCLIVLSKAVTLYGVFSQVAAYRAPAATGVSVNGCSGNPNLSVLDLSFATLVRVFLNVPSGLCLLCR